MISALAEEKLKDTIVPQWHDTTIKWVTLALCSCSDSAGFDIPLLCSTSGDYSVTFLARAIESTCRRLSWTKDRMNRVGRALPKNFNGGYIVVWPAAIVTVYSIQVV